MAATHAGELFTACGAELYLVDGVESALMQSGQFTLMLVKNPASQLAAVVAVVGEVQWPVGCDSTVVKKEEGSFTFMLPGPLTYNLVLSSPSADLQKLEHILEAYSDCGRPKPVEKEAQADAGSMATTERSCSESRKRTASAVITNPHMKGRMLRARRMSAVSKVFSKSLARGAISIDNHVESMDTAARGLRISSNLVLASVDAVAKVVEAVETGGRTLLESAGSAAAGVACEIQKNRQSDVNTFALSNLISAGWTLNKLGLLMIFRVITASMAIHSSGSSSSGSNRSGSSSSSEFRRLLSSSSSSSSLSSKSPATPSHGQGGGTTDVTSCALTLQPPAAAAAGSAMQSPPPVPPPPPLFSQNTPRIRHSNMPPPSSPLLPIAGEPSQAGLGFSDATLASTPIRIYKPRPTPAASVTGAPPPPPPSFLPRPPRFQPPPRG